MELKDILIRSLVTEKTTSQLHGDAVYAFEVGIRANKIQVKRAVESFYGVEVAAVRTMVVRGKLKRSGRHWSKRRNWKKAYVTLAPGEMINLFEAEA
jgi:large subunit ribosomal protein L23